MNGFATPAECRSACGAAVLAMEGLPVRDGETTLAADEWDVLRGWAGADAAALAADLCARTRRAVAAEFVEPRPLFLAGSLLTRLQPRTAAAGADGDNGGKKGDDDDDDDDYDSLAPHVDAANIASYDYSAVLYLNAAGHSFQGGEFVFRDGATTAVAAVTKTKDDDDDDGDDDDGLVGEDQVVEPARGRLLLFTSGCENLHQVRPVKPMGTGTGTGTRTDRTGTPPPAAARFVLAMWFTLAPDKGQDIPTAHNLNPAAATPAAAPAPADHSPGGGGGMSDLERMLEEKVASVKSSLGMSDEQLAKLLAKLPPM